MPRETPLFQVDAFTTRTFAGNPAAVCPLTAWLPDALMQAIAAENNLAETAFFAREGDGFRLRWFTPTTEIDLCGHATLASAFVLMTELEPARTQVVFATRSGPLTVTRKGTLYEMDFPSRPLAPTSRPIEEVAKALGAMPSSILEGQSVVAVFDHAAAVRALRPDIAAIAAMDTHALSVTAPGTDSDGDVDFVSRFFVPRFGVNEDPVTGSAHCALTPYWAERLKKNDLRARQVSARGGELACGLRGERVLLSGHAVMVIRGTLYLPTT
jgi:PhzF family phenazine biosynthesis protein